MAGMIEGSDPSPDGPSTDQPSIDDKKVGSSDGGRSSTPDGAYPRDLVHRSLPLSGGLPSQPEGGRGDLTIEGEPNVEDLASTIETKVDTRILQKGNELDDTEEIYLFVRNELDYEPYWGSMKGARQTLLEMAGNDMDLASLLIALYRGQEIPARYVYGTAEVDIEEALNWLGVEDDEVAYRLFQENGIPSAANYDGDDIESITIDHVWVAAWWGGEWHQMDPSFKQYTYVEAQPLGDHEEEIVQLLRDENGNISTNDDESIMLLNPATQSSIESLLNEQIVQSYANKTVEYLIDLGIDDIGTNNLEEFSGIFQQIGQDYFGSRTIVTQNNLPSSPALEVSITITYSKLPDHLFHSIIITLGDTSLEVKSAEIVGQRITLSYSPSTSVDKERIRGAEINTLVSKLVNFTSFLKVNGVIRFIGEPERVGHEQILSLRFATPSGAGLAIEYENSTVTVGGFYSVTFDLQKLSDENLLERNRRLDGTKKLIDLGFEDVPYEEVVGELYHIAALYYFHQLDSYVDKLSSLAGVTWNRHISAVIIGTSFYKQYQDDILVQLVPDGTFFDVIRDIINVYPAKEGADITNFIAQTGYHGSQLEHEVMDDVLSAPAISTQKIFNIASERRIPIYVLTMDNFDAYQDEIFIPSEALVEFENLLAAGFKISIPQKPITFNGWNGTAWLIEDPSTGALSAMISGGYAGGGSFFDPKKMLAHLNSNSFWIEMGVGLFQGGTNMADKLSSTASNVISIGYTVINDAVQIYNMLSDDPCNALINLYEAGQIVIIDTVGLWLSLSVFQGAAGMVAGSKVAVSAPALKSAVRQLTDKFRTECIDYTIRVAPFFLDFGQLSSNVEDNMRLFNLKIENRAEKSTGLNIKVKAEIISDFVVFYDNDQDNIVSKFWVGYVRDEPFRVRPNIPNDQNFPQGHFQETIFFEIYIDIGGHEIFEKRHAKLKWTYYDEFSVSPPKAVSLIYRLAKNQDDVEIDRTFVFSLQSKKVNDGNWFFSTKIKIIPRSGGLKPYALPQNSQWTNHGKVSKFDYDIIIDDQFKKGYHKCWVFLDVMMVKDSTTFTEEKVASFRIPIWIWVLSYKEPKDKDKDDLKKPGKDHPDDTFDVTGAFLSSTNTFDATLRYAVARGMTNAAKLNNYKTFLQSHVFGDVADEKEAYYRWSAERALRYEDLLNNIEAIEDEVNRAPYVAVLDSGFSDSTMALLGTLNEPFTIVDANFDPEIVHDHPILLVPSGGFYGLDNSDVFKYKLERYAAMGGTIIALAQQHGYEYAPLPGYVDGYGWLEDQKCVLEAVFINEYSHMFAWINTNTLSINADGYFTEYPENSTILLRRTANAQPAMLMYPWGEGRIIAADAYPDFTFGYGGHRQEESAFLKNLVQWAIDPELASYPREEELSLTLNVTNTGSSDATQVIFALVGPANDILQYLSVDQSVKAGETEELTIVLTTSTQYPGGIYSVDYVLVDEYNDTLAAKYYAARFAYSFYEESPGGFVYTLKQLQIWATAEEYVKYGAATTFMVHVNNNGEDDFTGNIAIGGHEEGAEGGRWWAYYGALTDVTIPAGETRDFEYTRNMTVSTSVYFGLFETGMDYENRFFHTGNDALCQKGVWVTWPQVRLEVKTLEGNSYVPDSQMRVDLEMENLAKLSFEYDVSVKVFTRENGRSEYQTYYDRYGRLHGYWAWVYDEVVQWNINDTHQVLLNGSDWPMEMRSTQLNLTYQIPSEIEFRNDYYLKLEVRPNGHDQILESRSYMLKVPGPQVAISYNLTPVGVDRTRLDLEYWSANDIIGEIYAQLYLQTGYWSTRNIIHSEYIDVQTGHQELSVVLEGDFYGAEVLRFQAPSYTGTIHSIPFANQFSVDIQPQQTIYVSGSTVSFDLQVENTGDFRNDLIVNGSLAAVGYELSQPLPLEPGEDDTVTFDIALTDIPFGRYLVDFTVHNGQITNSYAHYIDILPPTLEFSTDKTVYAAGENITLTLTNIGGFEANFDLSGGLGYYYTVTQLLDNLSLNAGENHTLVVTVPKTISSGSYGLYLEGLMEETQKRFSQTLFLDVEGAGFQVSYPTTEVDVADPLMFTVENTATFTMEAMISASLRRYSSRIEMTHNATLLAGEDTDLELDIPDTHESGYYTLYIWVHDNVTGKDFYFTEHFIITGWQVAGELLDDEFTVDDQLRYNVTNGGGVNATLEAVVDIYVDNERFTTARQYLNLTRGENATLQFDIPNAISGTAWVALTLVDSSLSRYNSIWDSNVVIKGLMMDISLEGTTFDIIDPLPVTIENVGGKDVNATLLARLNDDEFANFDLVINISETKGYDLYLPGSVESGEHTFEIVIVDRDTDRYVGQEFQIQVNGLEVDVEPEFYSFAAEEEANVTVFNPGTFGTNLTVNLTLWDGAQSKATSEDTAIVASGANASFGVTIPSALASGEYELGVLIHDEVTGVDRAFSFQVEVTALDLSIELDKTTYTGLESILVNVTNSGVVDTTANWSALLTDWSGLEMERYTRNFTLETGNSTYLALKIPGGMLTGVYTLEMEIEDTDAQESFVALFSLQVTELDIDVSLTLGETYFTDENLSALFEILASQALDNTTLQLEVLDNSRRVEKSGWEDLISTNLLRDGVTDGTSYFFSTEGGLLRALNPCDDDERAWQHYTKGNGLPTNNLTSLELIDSKVWIGWRAGLVEANQGLSGGIAILDPADDSWSYITEEDGFSGGSVVDMAYDGTGLWIATDPVFHPQLGRLGGGIEYYDLDQKTWDAYTVVNSDLVDDEQIAGLEVGQGLLFVHFELNEFDPQDELRGLNVMNISQETWTLWNVTNTGMDIDRITTLLVHGEELWMGHQTDFNYAGHGGVSVYNLSSQTWTIFNTTNSDIASDRVVYLTFNGATVWFLFSYMDSMQSYNGTNWTIFDSGKNIPFALNILLPCEAVMFGGWNGDEYFDYGIWIYDTTTYSSSRKHVGVPAYQYSDIECVEDELWLGADFGKGLIRIDSVTGAASKLTGLLNENVKLISYDGTNEVWIHSSNAGLNVYYLNNQSIHHFTTSNSSLLTTNYAAIEFYGDEVWITENQFSGNTVYIYDRNDGSWQLFDKDDSDDLLDRLKIKDLVFTGTDVWFAAKDGLGRYVRSNGSWLKYNSDNTDLPAGNKEFFDPVELYDGKIVCGYREASFPYDRHLVFFDPDALSWGFYTDNGFAIDREINGMALAEDILYLSSWSRGVYQVDLSNGSWTLYNQTNGLTSFKPMDCVLCQGNLAVRVEQYWIPLLWMSEGEYLQVWNMEQDYDLAASDSIVSEFNLTLIGNYTFRATLYNEYGQPIYQTYQTLELVEREYDIFLEVDREFYGVDESINITATVFNLGDRAGKFALEFYANDTLIHTAEAFIDGSSAQAIAYQHSAQDNFTIRVGLAGAGTFESLEVVIERPQGHVVLTAPEFGGRDPFNVSVIIANTGKVPLNGDLDLEGNDFVYLVAPGEQQNFGMDFTIVANRTFTADLSGDIIEQLSKDVEFGEAATVEVVGQELYSEGSMNLSLLSNNTGQLPLTFLVNLSLLGPQGHFNQSEEVKLAQAETLGHQLGYEVEEGQYTLTYDSLFGSGSIDFRVLPAQRLITDWELMDEGEGNFSMELVLQNTGAEAFAGTASLELPFLTNITSFVVPAETDLNLTFSFNVTGIEAGPYQLALTIDHEGESYFVDQTIVEVPPPVFALLDEPTLDEVYYPGQIVPLALNITNIGTLEGMARVHVNLSGVDSQYKEIYLVRGLMAQLLFNLSIPGDIAPGDYTLRYDLNGLAYDYELNIEGLKIAVEATLDQTSYQEGESAILDITVTDLAVGNPQYALSYTVVHGLYNQTRLFLLEDENETTFEIPVDFDQKIFFGVYTELGRSLYLNAFMVREAGSGLSFSTDKDSYEAGDEVQIQIEAEVEGRLMIESELYSIELDLEVGQEQVSFQLDEYMASKGYDIFYTFDNVTLRYTIEIEGFAARILEASFDKVAYIPGESVQLDFSLVVNSDITAWVQTWLVDSQGQQQDAYDELVNLTTGQNDINISYTPVTYSSGMHLVYYQVSLLANTSGSGGRGAGDEGNLTELFLTGGKEVFDVEGGSIVSFEVSQQVYRYDEKVMVTVVTYDAQASVLTITNEYTGQVLYSDTPTTELILDLGVFNGGYQRLVAELITPEFNTTSNASASFLVQANTAPTLTGLVQPPAGDPKTNFTYQVTYTDRENDLPVYMTISIDGVDHQMVAHEALDLEVTDGKVYAFTTTLPSGIHEYSFTTSDGQNVVSSGRLIGPQVESPYLPVGPTLSLTTEEAVLTVSEGTEAIFTITATNTGDEADVFNLSLGQGNLTLEPGESRILEVSIALAGLETGSQSVMLMGYPESNISRIANLELTLLGLSDVTISDLVLSKSTATSDDSIKVTFSIENQGTFIVPLVMVELLMDNKSLGMISIPNLAPGTTEPRDFDIALKDFRPGVYEVACLLVVDEEFETDVSGHRVSQQLKVKEGDETGGKSWLSWLLLVTGIIVIISGVAYYLGYLPIGPRSKTSSDSTSRSEKGAVPEHDASPDENVTEMGLEQDSEPEAIENSEEEESPSTEEEIAPDEPSDSDKQTS